jgi:SAM-dependent methyltransferase
MIDDDLRKPLGKMSVFRKLLAGGVTRKTRLHDELGQLIGGGRLLRNGPRALFTGLMRKLADQRPDLPWISYDAQQLLDKAMGPGFRVLEFGSGMSTAWYARRAAQVTSIEGNQEWYEIVRARLAGLSNVDFRFAPDRAAYVENAPDAQFDLIMIDGAYRDDCARFAVEHLAANGIIYLDNCDKGASEITGNVPEARRILLAFAAKNGIPVAEFTDFAPTQLHVQRGLWVGPLPA